MVCPDCLGDGIIEWSRVAPPGMSQCPSDQKCETCEGTGEVMNKIREEFEKYYKTRNIGIENPLYNNGKESVWRSWEACTKSKDKEIKKLKGLLKKLYENKSELDKLYILLNRPEVREALKDGE